MNEIKWSDAKTNWAQLFWATDPNASYDFDDTVLFKNGTKYALFFDSGCSCNSSFEDPNQGGDVYTKAQLLKLVNNWEEYSSEGEMKKWILENIK